MTSTTEDVAPTHYRWCYVCIAHMVDAMHLHVLPNRSSCFWTLNNIKSNQHPLGFKSKGRNYSIALIRCNVMQGVILNNFSRSKYYSQPSIFIEGYENSPVMQKNIQKQNFFSTHVMVIVILEKCQEILSKIFPTIHMTLVTCTPLHICIWLGINKRHHL